jgi:hypothetical protein
VLFVRFVVGEVQKALTTETHRDTEFTQRIEGTDSDRVDERGGKILSGGIYGS